MHFSVEEMKNGVQVRSISDRLKNSLGGFEHALYLSYQDTSIERNQYQDYCIKSFGHHQGPYLVLQALVVSRHIPLSWFCC